MMIKFKDATVPAIQITLYQSGPATMDIQGNGNKRYILPIILESDIRECLSKIRLLQQKEIVRESKVRRQEVPPIPFVAPDENRSSEMS